MSKDEDTEEIKDEVTEEIKRIKTFKDVQRTHLEKLMSNPDKPVHIPDRPEGLKPKEPPEFVRFYMGSSAGAGSEVFHVYRHLRRRETLRQQCIDEGAKKEMMEEEFQDKLVKNYIQAEERTGKKRAKRLKKKQRQVEKKKSSVKTEDKTPSPDDDEGQAQAQSNQNDHKESADDANSDQEDEAHFIIGGR